MRIPLVICAMCLCLQTSWTQCDSLPLVFFPSEVFLCAGNSLLMDPGIDAVSYEWSTGDTTQTITLIEEGTYCLTITDSLGCMSSGCIDVIIPPAPIVEFSSDPWACGPYTIDMFVLGDFFVEYQWSTGDTTEWIWVQEEGEYCVTVTDQFGCRGSGCFTFEQIIVEPEIMGELEFCVGEETVLYTNEFYVNYLWSNGATSQQLLTNVPGLYCLTVTDIHGCTGSDCVFVDVKSNVVMTIDSLICEATFLNMRSANFAAVSSGSPEIVRASSCDTIVVIVITEVPMDIYYTIGGNASTGSATIHISEIVGGVEPITFLWSTGARTASISGLFPGEYSVTIADAGGCTALNTFYINPPTRPDVTEGKPIVIAPNPFTSDIIIHSEATEAEPGTVQIYDCFGQRVVDQLLIDSRVQLKIAGSPGVYVVVVINSNGMSNIHYIIKQE